MNRLTVSDDDCLAYIGRKIRIEKGDTVLVGTVNGMSAAVVAVGVSTVIRPWELQTKDATVAFVPSDGWKLYATP